MISIFQAAVIGLIQGLTELFPISSLGHTVIIPQLLGWNIHQNDQYFLTFIVATHFATAVVLFLFFWKEWVLVAKGLWRSLMIREISPDDTYAKLGWLLVIGTVPAGILGLLFQQSLGKLFASAQIASLFLMLNGIILFLTENLSRRLSERKRRPYPADTHVAKLSYKQAVGIGIAQAGALFPGISRSGSSMAGGLLAGLNNEDAARFSFLLATPVIGAAALLKLPGLFHHSLAPIRMAIMVGAVCAAITAFLSVRFLVRYFQTRTLTPFAIYCFMAGIVYFTYLRIH